MTTRKTCQNSWRNSQFTGRFYFIWWILFLGITFRSYAAESERMSVFVDSLISEMTLEEKVGQTNQYFGGRSKNPNSNINAAQLDEIRAGRIGSYLNVLGADFLRELQRVAVEESRLGIPLIFALDVVHGFKTIFPVPLASAATWEPETVEHSARIAATEATAAGLHWTFAPMIDIARDPRWGRIVEGAGEDPYLGAMMAMAQVRGFQGNNLADSTTLLACPKHFAAYGAAIGGRDYNSADVSDRTLREIYLPPFLAAVQEGAATMMIGFNDIDGIPMTVHKAMIRDLLKETWGFNGLVISDWNAITELLNHGVARDSADAGIQTLEAGVDMDMISRIFLEELGPAVQSGMISPALLDDAVRRILTAKYKLGLFEDPYRYNSVRRETEDILHPDHIDHARVTAQKAVVLLKNEGALLPLKKDLKRIAVIGSLADDRFSPLGSWRAAGDAKDVVTLLEGIRRTVSPKTEVLFTEGCDVNSLNKAGFAKAIHMAVQSDAVILVLGEDYNMSGEARSRSELCLPGVQLDLAREIIDTGTPTVVVLKNGRPLSIPWLAEYAQTILETWILGVQGGPAVADIIFGDVNPGGKLPVTLTRHVGQVPKYYNERNTGRPASKDLMRDSARYFDLPITPLFPFGHGLSYTQFNYSNLGVNVDTEAGATRITCQLRNTGDRAGNEVVQLYIRDRVADVSRPVKMLKGFNRVHLASGEVKLIQFNLDWKQLAFYNRQMEYVVEPGLFEIHIGSSSEDIRLNGSFELDGTDQSVNPNRFTTCQVIIE
ncbi:glycoside hydrolase family 3 C-terminal domain-containing protein [candidate division KSB1 bacterium]|nr:glycoside hydrolase family 3 C-terminal domain-containing protein [candidate division KSB1 bacterium]